MFSRFFIERPIFAAVVAIIICLAGAGRDVVLPIQQYPTITPVQVTVSATYPGADSKTLADSVASPIEAQINGVDNMLYMSSTSSANGQLTLTVYFSLETNPDIAQVQVQNRVNLALPQLPTAVTQLGVSVQKKSSSIMMLIAVFGTGDRYTGDYIANYANVYVLDAIKRVNGAGQAQIMGVPDQAMRIWMNPDRMASLGITTTDIANAVQRAERAVRRRPDRPAADVGAGRAHLSGGDAGAVHRAAAVREDHPPREPGRQRDRARSATSRAPRSGCASTSSTPSSTARRRRSSRSTCSPARTGSRCRTTCARRSTT